MLRRMDMFDTGIAPVDGIRAGIGGWTYAPWRDNFYPKGLVQRRELEYLAGQLGSAEINGSFYSLQRPERYRWWAEKAPDDFVFAVKGNRFLTHMLNNMAIFIFTSTNHYSFAFSITSCIN